MCVLQFYGGFLFLFDPCDFIILLYVYIGVTLNWWDWKYFGGLNLVCLRLTVWLGGWVRYTMYEYTPPVTTSCATPCQFCDFYTQQPYATSLPPPGSQCLDMEGKDSLLSLQISYCYILKSSWNSNESSLKFPIKHIEWLFCLWFLHVIGLITYKKRKNWKSRQTGDAIEPMVGCSPYILIMLFAWHSEL